MRRSCVGVLVAMLAVFPALTAPAAEGPTGPAAEIATLHQQALALHRAGRAVEAAAQEEKALFLAERTFGRDHLDTARIAVWLAEMYANSGQPQKAEACLLRAKQVFEAQFGADHVDVGNVCARLGGISIQAGAFDRAVQYLEKALPILDAKVGANAPLAIDARSTLGLAYSGIGRHAEAEKLLKESLQAADTTLGKESPSAFLALKNLGQHYKGTQRPDDAIPLLEDWLSRNQRAGGNHPGQWFIRTLLGSCQLLHGDIVNADKNLNLALELHRARSGRDDPIVAGILSELVLVYGQRGRRDYVKARQYAEQCLKIRLATFGPDHPETATAYGRLSGIHFACGQYADAEAALRKGLDIIEASTGKDSPASLMLVHDMANFYLGMNRPADAKTYVLRAVKIYDDAYGRKALMAQPGAVLQNLANVYARTGEPEKADARLRETVATLEERLGKDHLNFGRVLLDVSSAYETLGQRAEARQYAERGLAILKARLGAEHPEVGTVLQGLGRLCISANQYAEAEAYLQECLRLRRKAFGETHMLVSPVLFDLTEVYLAMQRDADAAEMLRLCMRLVKENPQANTDTMAGICGQLALVCEKMGRLADAETLLKRSLAMREAAYGPSHPDVAWCVGKLANLYQHVGRCEDAVPLAKRTVEILETVRGKDHPAVADALNILGQTYMLLGKYPDADQALRRSLAILRANPGANDQVETIALESLSEVYLRGGGWKEAAAFCAESRRTNRRQMAAVLPALSPEEQLVFLYRGEKGGLAHGLSMGLTFADKPEVVEASAEWLLNGKAISAEFLAEAASLARDADNPDVASVAKELAGVRDQLAKSIMGSMDSKEETATASPELLRKRERELARKLSQLTGNTSREDSWVTLAEVRKAVPPGAVLVEIALFPVRDFDPNTKVIRWKPPHYAAWVIPSTGAGDVTLVDLGDARTIETAVGNALAAILTPAPGVKSLGDPQEYERVRAACSPLTDLIWKPLQTAVGNAKSVILSPDAGLWLFPWEALPVESNKFLVEQRRISYVVSGRDLLMARGKTASGPAMVFADPDYDMELTAPTAAATAKPGTAFTAWNRAYFAHVKPSGILGAARFRRLPDSGTAAKAIAPRLGSYLGETPTILLDKQATDVKFKALQRPRAVVLLTHGFFLPDLGLDNLPLPEDLQRARGRPDPGAAAKQGTVQNPLLRCGLALAGANHHVEAKTADDGIVTGLEVLGMDLRGTELVLLGACETGVGAVRVGEGVASLRQAFQLAGARTVVATLWSIPERESLLLMRTFFGNLAQKQNKAAALNNAQLSVIEDLRRTGVPHPRLWAAFTLTGDGQ